MPKFPNSNYLPDDDDYLLMQGRPNREAGLRFLGRYREHSIYKTFAKYGITKQVEQLGFEQIEVRILAEDGNRQRLKVLALKEGQVGLLGDIIVTSEDLTFDPQIAPLLGGSSYKTLVIQWIRLQNPFAEFSQKRPALPGQHFPGLGIGSSTKEMMVGIGVVNGFHLITNAPEFYHNALMYHPDFLYLDPAREGRLRAIWRDLGRYGLAPVSWAIYLGCVELNGNKYQWEHGEQIRPLCQQISRHFSSEPYQMAIQEEMARCHFTFNEELYQSLAPLDANGRAKAGSDSKQETER